MLSPRFDPVLKQKSVLSLMFMDIQIDPYQFSETCIALLKKNKSVDCNIVFDTSFWNMIDEQGLILFYIEKLYHLIVNGFDLQHAFKTNSTLVSGLTNVYSNLKTTESEDGLLFCMKTIFKYIYDSSSLKDKEDPFVFEQEMNKRRRLVK